MSSLDRNIINELGRDEHRPRCPNCNLGMWLTKVVPIVISSGLQAERRYECEICLLKEVVVV